MASVELRNVRKAYPNGFTAIHDLSLEVHDGELLVLVGPSGCGKSTALRMIAGLEDITGGELRIGDRVVNDVAPKDRDIAMVFQNYALYPHMTVYQTIGFALKMARVPKAEADRRIRQAAATLELEALLDRRPGQLSGGQRQRVAMGRAIVRRPAVFLMDEPLSNLDAKLRVQMRAEIARLQDRLGVTMVYVTHDQVEAMTMGDRVAVLKDGRLQQIDAPKVIYDRPATVFVAAFIGSPAMNLFAGRINGSVLELGSQRLSLGPDVFARRPGLCRYDAAPIIVGIRPEDFADRALAEGVPADRCLTATVRLVEALGSDVIVHFAIDAVAIDAGDPDAAKDRPLTDTNVVGRFHRSSAVAPGQTAAIAVTVNRLHFFDPVTRDAVQ